MTFREKWLTNESHLAVGLKPQIANLPAPIARYDDPFLPFGRAIIEATHEFACAFVFDLASYLALGAAGARALERTIPLVPNNVITILHGPFYTADYAAAAFEEAFAVDAVTLGQGKLEVVSAYTKQPNHAAFVMSKSALSPANMNVGFYDATWFELAGKQIQWVTEPIIYASGLDDFQNAAREAAQKYR